MRSFVTLGMFILDEFEYLDDNGTKIREGTTQIGGGGTYANIGARIWLQDDQTGMIIDRGHDWPLHIQSKLQEYGSEMWIYRDHSEPTTCALNSYRGDLRGFEYLTKRIQLTPHDLVNTALAAAEAIHFICSPTRAKVIVGEIDTTAAGWDPVTIYEPIPHRCVPEELEALLRVLDRIHVFSPNAEEALSFLSVEETPTKTNIESAARTFLQYGVGRNGSGTVVIRSGALGAFVLTRALETGRWIDAYWTSQNDVLDVTGAGNSFLGGLAAGLKLTKGDVIEAALYASVSASFVVQQPGLPSYEGGSSWNHDSPQRRLDELRSRVGIMNHSR